MLAFMDLFTEIPVSATHYQSLSRIDGWAYANLYVGQTTNHHTYQSKALVFLLHHQQTKINLIYNIRGHVFF